MKRRSTAFALAVWSAVTLAQSPAPAIDTIRQADLKADLFFLASDAMKGRLKELAGLQKAHREFLLDLQSVA